MRAILSFIFISFNIYVYGQQFKADDHFKNGQPKYKGKYTSCVVDVVGGVHMYEKRKTGKWIYYYPSGSIKRIEHHTKTKSCKTTIFKEEVWQYFNEKGALYLEEKYEQDTLRFKEIPIYTKDLLVAQLTVYDDKTDTLYHVKSAKSKNLIPNPGFESYFFKPVHIVNDGQDAIEYIIPYWRSPDNATPDYYNTNRRIAGVSHHWGNHNGPPEGTGYIGLMLYFHPQSKSNSWDPTKSNIIYGEEYVYSEAIQSRLTETLIKNKKYCFKAKIILSQNAGLSIDNLGVYFSDQAVTFRRDDFPESAQLTFDKDLSSSSEWATLCGVYEATGNEQFITLGRFTKPGMTNIKVNNPAKSSALDINKSAYYLLDDLHLFEVASYEECNCSEGAISEIENINMTDRSLNDFFNVTSDNKVILKNVRFDFDSANFNSSSLPELHKLYNYLNTNSNKKIFITGHTDDEGSAEYNDQLSLERALSIKKWLVERGIDSSRISCEGKGFDIPLNDNLNEKLRAKNRRVEFEIIE